MCFGFALADGERDVAGSNFPSREPTALAEGLC